MWFIYNENGDYILTHKAHYAWCPNVGEYLRDKNHGDLKIIKIVVDLNGKDIHFYTENEVE